MISEDHRNKARSQVVAAYEALDLATIPVSFLHALADAAVNAVEPVKAEQKLAEQLSKIAGRVRHRAEILRTSLFEEIEEDLRSIASTLFSAPPGSGDALLAAYKAGFEVSGQGYNGEIFPEFETDDDWLAKRDRAIAQIQNVGRMSDGRKDVGKKSDETEAKAKNSTKSMG